VGAQTQDRPGGQRIEITGDFSHYDFKNYERYGLFSERISYQTRYFVPTNEQGVKAIEALTKNNSIVSAQKKHKASETIAQHSDTSFKKGSYPASRTPRSRNTA
jgi:alpha-D-ribose 1-methylphosphonate 5-triphosphate synthase subunit PhnI